MICVCFYRVYVWTDDQGKKLKCSAPLYFDYALSYIQDLLTDEDVFPTKAGTFTFLLFFFFSHCIVLHCISFKLFSPVFSPRFSVSRWLRLSGPEGVSAVVQDSGSHLLVSLQRNTGAGPAPAPQHSLHTPHTLLPAAFTTGARGHRAAAGPHLSSGTVQLKEQTQIIVLIHTFLKKM